MATYYAQSAGVNITAANLWNSAVNGSGTSFTVTLQSGTTYGITSDPSAVLVLNGKNITVNVSLTVGTIRNDTLNGATAGGTATLSDGVTLTSDVQAGGTATCVSITGSASCSIVGNSTGSNTTSGSPAIDMNSTGTLTFTGSLSGSPTRTGFAPSAGLQCSAGTSNITATSITASASTSQAGLFNPGNFSAIINVTGPATGGSGANSNAIDLRGNSTFTLTGAVAGGSGGAGVNLQGTVTATINGTATGGGASGVTVAQSSPVTITRAKGGPNSTSGVGVAAGTSGNVTVTEIEFGAAGASPTSGAVRFNNASNQALCIIQQASGGSRTLSDPISTGLYPSASDVRSGTSYAGGARTGTLAVPASSLVAAGEAVDNTTGTAAITASAIQSACDAALTAFSGGRLGNAATVASTGQQLANALTP